MLFNWDKNKAKINLKKHGVSFEEALTAFDDEEGILFDDPDHSQEEQRFLLLGISSQKNLLIVCHCYRGEDDMVRIISARKATRRESVQYRQINKGW